MLKFKAFECENYCQPNPSSPVGDVQDGWGMGGGGQQQPADVGQQAGTGTEEPLRPVQG